MEFSSTTLLTSLGAGCAACAVAYVLWGPERLFRERGHCPGLANLGNTCFLNAVLQALASLPAVCSWVEASCAEHPARRLAVAIGHTLSVLRGGGAGGVAGGGGEEVHSPTGILRALVWHRWSVDFKQQDAHELYHVLLTTLEEEALAFSGSQCGLGELLQDTPPTKPVSGCRPRTWSKAGCVSVPSWPVVCPLEGLLASELCCCHCRYSFPVKYERFDSLSLSLPQYKHSCSLMSCLSSYMHTEIVQNVRCPRCSKSSLAKEQRSFTKRLRVARLPACLCVHLQRTLWLPSGHTHKTSTAVSFPLSLSAASLSSSPISYPVSHELAAVVEHMGGPWSGHYATYRKLNQSSSSSSSSSWVYTSDATVYSATASDVLRAQAYMLFYQRVAPPT